MLPADVPVPRLAADDRFETLFEQAPFSVQLLSPAGRTLRVNRAWKELWSTADGDPLLDYVLGEYDILADAQLEEKGIVPLLRRAFAGESIDLPAIHYDPRELGKPGRARWVRASAHPVHDADGSLREVMLIHEDVTDRLGAEEALRTSARAARTAEEQLRVAVRAGRIGIWDWDIARNVVEWTDEVYALHGVPPGGFGGTVEAFAALVSCLADSFAKSPELGEDGISGGSPDEGFAVVVVVL